MSSTLRSAPEASVPSALRPTVHPSPEARPFWEAAARGELIVPECPTCGPFFYPRTSCPQCGSRQLGWLRASGRGRIHAFTIQHHTSVAELREALPFITAIVELDEGPRLMSFIVGVEPDPAAIACGQPVEVAFLELDGGLALPVFRPPAGRPDWATAPR